MLVGVVADKLPDAGFVAAGALDDEPVAGTDDVDVPDVPASAGVVEPRPEAAVERLEGLSVFLSVFDLPEVAATFYPPKRPAEPPALPAAPAAKSAAVARQLPSLDQVIQDGAVLALNMPAGTNSALARAGEVMLKQAWLQTLLRRPAEMARRPARKWRPALFLYDEYPSFVTVGEDDPAGEEKMVALTRQSRLIRIVATQSISSLRSVLGQSEAWRALLQTVAHARLSCRWPTTPRRRSPAPSAAKSPA